METGEHNKKPESCLSQVLNSMLDCIAKLIKKGMEFIKKASNTSRI
jgi:hypothetical protein